MAANKKPGNPWNQFGKKKQPPTAIKKRTPGASVKVEKNRALPPGKKGGAPAKPGGAIVKASSNKPVSTGGPIQQVRVREVSKPQVSGSPNRRLPGGAGGADSVRSSGVRTGRPGPNRLALPGNRSRADDFTDRVKARGAGSLRTGIAGAVASAAASKFLDPAARKAGESIGRRVLRPIGRAIDDRMVGTNSKDEAQRRKSAQPLRQMSASEARKAPRLPQASPSNTSAKASAPSTRRLSPPSMPSSVRRVASGGVGNSSSTPAAKAAPSKPMEKAYGDSGKDLYMSSKKNNPLMQRTFGYQTGDGPGRQSNNSSFNTKQDLGVKADAPKTEYKLPDKVKGAKREFDPKKRRSPYQQ